MMKRWLRLPIRVLFSLAITLNPAFVAAYGTPALAAPTDQPPTLTRNTGITVLEGSTGNVISASMLAANDPDTPPSELVYTLTTLPAHGTLRLSGIALGVGGAFTQADINGDLVTYDHDGSETLSDAFAFDLRDATTTLPITTFAITVIPVSTDTQGPAVSGVAVDPNPVSLGTDVTLWALVDDGGTGGSSIQAAEYSVDGSAFLPLAAADGTFDGVSEAVTGTISATSLPGSGLHNVCVRGMDAAGNVGLPSCVLLVVYDASLGYVAGAGWIDSPVGADAADPSLAGAATFDVASTYAKHRTAPTGQAQFTFVAGGLDFRSTGYDSVIVTRGGSGARIKGTGTINGAGDDEFMIWATSGTPGTFRIKITDRVSGNVVYDSGETALGGGSILIQKVK